MLSRSKGSKSFSHIFQLLSFVFYSVINISVSLYTVNDVLSYDGVKKQSKILPADLQLSPSSPLCCQMKRLSLYLFLYFDIFIYLSIFLCGLMTCFRFRHGAIWSGAAARRTQTVNKLLKLELNSRNGAFKLQERVKIFRESRITSLFGPRD